MDYVKLGSAGLKVSRLCLGTMTYGSKKWREWVLEEAEARPFYRRALEAGINFFDSADMYSLGVSEEITGRALKEYGPSRDKLVVATKVFNAMGDIQTRRVCLANTSCIPLKTVFGGCRRITWIFTRSIALTRTHPLKKRSRLWTSWCVPAKCCTSAPRPCTHGNS